MTSRGTKHTFQCWHKYPIQYTFASSTCSTGWSRTWIVMGQVNTAYDRKLPTPCTWLYVLNTMLFGLLQLQFTYILIILQYHTDIKLLHPWHVCSCSHSTHTDHLFTSILWHSNFSKDFTEKKGVFHIEYILSFITPCWV